jgi:integrase
MARARNRLTAIAVDKLKTPGMHADGLGLYLQITDAGTKSWIYRFMMRGRAREMGLGPLHTVTLKEARDKAAECRKKHLEGIDPIEARRAERTERALAEANAITFKACAERCIASHEAGWRNAKHRAQWRSTLETYAYPIIGEMSVQSIDTAAVMRVLEQNVSEEKDTPPAPLWHTKTETASRLRGRIESVLDWAAARQYRKGDNPARWRGHLDQLLPKRAKAQRVKHHAALPYPDVGEFVKELRQQEGTAARAFEFCILTATRTSETVGAKWPEIDMNAATWTIPAERIKAGREHRVPLSAAAMSILRTQLKARYEGDGEYVFPGGKRGAQLSNMAFLMVLRRMGRMEITAHGFRSTFRDWAAERTNYPREVAEMALAHTIGDKAEAAYRRGDLFAKRRRMMEDWAKYCGTVQKQAGKVLPMMSAASASND